MFQNHSYVPVFPSVHGTHQTSFHESMPHPLPPPKCPQEFPLGTPLLYFDEKTRSIVSDVPTELKQFDPNTQSYRAPPGYSFVWLESISKSLSPSPSPVSAMNRLVPMSTLSLAPARSRSVTPEPEREPSKHDRISELLMWIENRFGENGLDIYNQMKQAQGSHVLRVDIKTITGVLTFPVAIDAVCGEVTILALSTRSSLKRNKQRKGLSVYMKVQTETQKQRAKEILKLKCTDQHMWVIKDILPKA